MCLTKKKKKLLFVVGAGASAEFGMPGVTTISTLFDQWCKKYFTIPSLNISLYKYLEDQINAFYNSVKKPIKASTNFEEVLFTALNIYSMNNTNRTNSISAFYDFKSIPPIVAYNKNRVIEFSDFLSLASILIDELFNEFRTLCGNLDKTKSTELQCLNTFLENLRKDYEISVMTFNYDNIFFRLLPNWNTGFNSKGEFDPSLILNNKFWNFFYHMHGSVHFDMVSNSKGLHTITLNPDLLSKFQQNSGGRGGQTTIEEQYVLTSNIIAGYGKAYQIQRSPFYLYFLDFGKRIYEADSVIFAGYGFNDFYINNLIAESFDYNRKRPVLVLTYSRDDEDPMQFRQDNWAINLTETITTDSSRMSTWKHVSAPIIADLKTNKEFEVSKNKDYPLSIWHGGFLEACRNYDLVIKELNNWA